MEASFRDTKKRNLCQYFQKYNQTDKCLFVYGKSAKVVRVSFKAVPFSTLLMLKF